MGQCGSGFELRTSHLEVRCSNNCTKDPSLSISIQVQYITIWWQGILIRWQYASIWAQGLCISPGGYWTELCVNFNEHITHE